jgi:hypothetical protein
LFFAENPHVNKQRLITKNNIKTINAQKQYYNSLEATSILDSRKMYRKYCYIGTKQHSGHFFQSRNIDIEKKKQSL